MAIQRTCYEVQAISPCRNKFYTVAKRKTIGEARAERDWREAPNEVLDALIGSSDTKHRILKVESTCTIVE